MIWAVTLIQLLIVVVLALAVIGLYVEVAKLRSSSGGEPGAAAPEPARSLAERLASSSAVHGVVRGRPTARVLFTRPGCERCHELLEQLSPDLADDVVVVAPNGGDPQVPGVTVTEISQASFSALHLPGLPFLATWQDGQLVGAGFVSADHVSSLRGSPADRSTDLTSTPKEHLP